MDIFIFGLTLGLMYALIVAGFALILGTSRIVDMTYGMYYTVSAYSFYYFTPTLGVGISALLSIVITVILALLIHRFILYPLRANFIAVMIASAALAYALQRAIVLLFGTQPKFAPLLIQGATEVFGATIYNQRLLGGGLAILCLGLLWLFLNRTKRGQGIRAIVEQPQAATLVGVNRKTSHVIVACISAGLAALGGITVAPVFMLTPTTWLTVLLLSFSCVVVAGMGSIFGVLIAVFIIAYVEVIVSSFIPRGAFFRGAVYLIIMVVVLLIRPWGFLGKKEA